MLGAVPIDDDRVDVPRVGAGRAARRGALGAARRAARARRRRDLVRGRRRARTATTTSSSSTERRGRIRARACSRTACAARRASSTRGASTSRPARSSTLDELVIYELHVGTFSDEGTFDGVIPRLRGAARARHDGDRADARRDVPGQPQLGLRRPLQLRAASRVRRAGRARATRRRRAPRGPRRDPRRRLQPHRPGLGGDRRVRPVLHRPPRHVLGRGDRLFAARRARVGDPERRAVDARLQDRRPAPRRRARDLRRLAAARARRAEAARRRRSSSPR